MSPHEINVKTASTRSKASRPPFNTLKGTRMKWWKFFGYSVLAVIIVVLLGSLYAILHGDVIAHNAYRN